MRGKWSSSGARWSIASSAASFGTASSPASSPSLQIAATRAFARRQAEADRPGEARLEEEERGDGRPRSTPRLRFMKGSKPEQARRSDSQSAVSTTACGAAPGEGVVVHVEHAGRLAEALQHHAEPDEVERRVVQHRAAEQAQAELHRAPGRAGRSRRDPRGTVAAALVRPEVECSSLTPPTPRGSRPRGSSARSRARRATDRTSTMRLSSSQVMYRSTISASPTRVSPEALDEVRLLARRR